MLPLTHARCVHAARTILQVKRGPAARLAAAPDPEAGLPGPSKYALEAALRTLSLMLARGPQHVSQWLVSSKVHTAEAKLASGPSANKALQLGRGVLAPVHAVFVSSSICRVRCLILVCVGAKLAIDTRNVV